VYVADVPTHAVAAHELTALEGDEPDADAGSARRASLPTDQVPPPVGTPQPTGEILGIVRSRIEEQRIEGGRVVLSRAPALPAQPGGPVVPPQDKYWSLTDRFDASGVFHFAGLEPGQYRLVVDPTDFERRQELATVVAGGTANLEVIVDPTYAMKLDLVLQREIVPGKLQRLQASTFESVGPLRPALLATCPPVGTDLAADARRLATRTRQPRGGREDVWMVASFERPSDGWACALLGDRVIAAAPFKAGQESVELNVKQEELSCCRCKLDVLVLDQANRLTIPDASVGLVWSGGARRELFTNTHGIARAEDLVSGELRVQITAPGYRKETRRLSLATGGPVRLESVELTRSITLRGSVRFPENGSLTYSVTASRIDSADKRLQRTVSFNIGEFEIQDLVPGEYAVGIVPATRVPDPERIRRGEVEGWKIVALPATTAVEFEITESIAHRILAQKSR
jgi:hypothetical protein